MDPEPNLKNSNTFIDSKKIKPFISYNENNGIKSFNTISMIDESESIVLTAVNFDTDYNFLCGKLTALTFKSKEYHGLKNIINQGISLTDLLSCNLNYAETAVLNINSHNTTLEISLDGKMKQIPFIKSMLQDIVLEDKYIFSKTDKINNFLLEYKPNKTLSTKIFKDIEEEEFKKQFKAIKTEKQKIKSA